jgi:SAM-dependent methyltransferase
VVRCTSCKLLFTDPRPTESDIQSFYADDFHSNLREPGASEDLFGRKFEFYCDWLLHYVKPGKSLDIGCATGLFVKKLQDRGFQAEGYEGNVASAAWGRSQYGVTIHTGFFSPDASQAGNCDLITLCDVLEHTINPLEYLRHIRCLLSPGGAIMVTIPHIWCIESLYYRMLSRLFRREWLWQTCQVPFHTWEFTPLTARRVFEQAGFRIVAFRRWEPTVKMPINWRELASLIHIPPLILKVPLLGNRFGIKMIFLLTPC